MLNIYVFKKDSIEKVINVYQPLFNLMYCKTSVMINMNLFQDELKKNSTVHDILSKDSIIET